MPAPAATASRPRSTQPRVIAAATGPRVGFESKWSSLFPAAHERRRPVVQRRYRGAAAVSAAADPYPFSVLRLYAVFLTMPPYRAGVAVTPRSYAIPPQPRVHAPHARGKHEQQPWHLLCHPSTISASRKKRRWVSSRSRQGCECLRRDSARTTIQEDPCTPSCCLRSVSCSPAVRSCSPATQQPSVCRLSCRRVTTKSARRSSSS